jgi:predicted nucleic acid-binding protein
MTWVCPEADVVTLAFTRRDPDLLTVNQMTALVRARRIAIAPWVRQQQLAATRDARQLDRLAQALAAFPAPRVDADDYVEAARREQRLREQGSALSPAQALSWTVADRHGLLIWTNDPVLVEQDCPLFRV